METKEKHMPDWSKVAAYLSGNASQEDKAEIDNWRNQSVENQQSFKKAEKIWNLSNNVAAADVNVTNAWKKVKKRANIDTDAKSVTLWGTTGKYLLRIAAILVFGIVSWYSYKNFFSIKNVHAGDEIAQFTLDDGSVVDLNRHSRLTYPSSFLGNVREVQLEGEAFFDIARNPEKPFIIKTATAEIKVLGTSFNVLNKKNGDVEVIVNSGVVSVTSYSNSKNVTLHENEKAVFSLKRGSLTKSTNKNVNYMSWKTKTFIFKETSLSEVYSLLGKVYNVKIEVKKPLIMHYKLTATYENEDADNIMKMIDKTFGLESSRTEKTFSVRDTTDVNL